MVWVPFVVRAVLQVDYNKVFGGRMGAYSLRGRGEKYARKGAKGAKKS